MKVYRGKPWITFRGKNEETEWLLLFTIRLVLA